MMSTEEVLRLTVTALMSRTGEQQRDLAAAIGQAQAQISRKQSGRAHWSLSDVDALAAHWGMPVLDLLAGPTHAVTKLAADRVLAGRSAQTLIPLAPSVNPDAAPKARKGRAAKAPQVPEEPEAEPTPAPAAAAEPVYAQEPDRDWNGGLVYGEMEPCVLCSQPVTTRAGGRPQHVYGHCPPVQTDQPQPPAAADTADQPQPRPAAPTTAYAPEALVAYVESAVTDALRVHGGDMGEALEALKKRAIPAVMELFERTRVGGRYSHSQFPPTDAVLKKRSQKGADQIWEGRPNWANRDLIRGADPVGNPVEVTRLDTNAAYLSAMKCFLPIGQLQEVDTDRHDPERSGVYLISPPEWGFADLPNPLGNRKEPGDLWVTDETVRLLAECADLGLCEHPVIRRALLSGATEGLLEKLRRTLTQARKNALASEDDLLYEYVKAMYSKFVSTIGESTANDALRRPDWMHLIRSKAFANLWRKAFKAHSCGLTVVEISGTDELHVIGDWRTATTKTGKPAFPEGRNLNEMKAKATYTLGGKK
ncbi:acyltransferase [Streptomyces lydicamycinicus]|uniref:acyltransferase n=1 Tax=Streptomyces lydicamycinicus TaxID=1546107 RepID=UPI003C2E0822